MTEASVIIGAVIALFIQGGKFIAGKKGSLTSKQTTIVRWVAGILSVLGAIGLHYVTEGGFTENFWVFVSDSLTAFISSYVTYKGALKGKPAYEDLEAV